MPLRWSTDPIMVDILNGVQKLKRAFHRGRYRVTREVWDRGEKGKGNSIRRALMSYAWDKQEKPKKDGREDPLDALRYDCIYHYWSDTDIERKAGGSRTPKSRKVKVGGGRKDSF
jgi:hypothetical protein